MRGRYAVVVPRWRRWRVGLGVIRVRWRHWWRRDAWGCRRRRVDVVVRL